MNDYLMYMYQLQNLVNYRVGVMVLNGVIGGQLISVVSLYQVFLMQLNFFDKNLDIFLLGFDLLKFFQLEIKMKKKVFFFRKLVFDFSK